MLYIKQIPPCMSWQPGVWEEWVLQNRPLFSLSLSLTRAYMLMCISSHTCVLHLNSYFSLLVFKFSPSKMYFTLTFIRSQTHTVSLSFISSTFASICITCNMFTNRCSHTYTHTSISPSSHSILSLCCSQCIRASFYSQPVS